MKINYSKNFSKEFKKLPKYAEKSFEKRLNLFLENPKNPILNNHKLNGEFKDYRSINISGDYRLIFFVQKQELFLVHIGSHSQLYK